MNYFKPSEFACGCGRQICDAEAMDIAFVFKLNGLRLSLGLPMHINSGVRCPFWNAHEHGAEDSMHLKGRAADIRCADGAYMRKLVMLALAQGFAVGIKAHMVHLDDRADVVMWGY